MNTDIAIKSAKQDALGRTKFARSLALALSRRKVSDDSIVVGLEGPWGCGKTSVKNMALEALQAPPGVEFDVLDFNPWKFSGRDSILRGFFSNMTAALSRGESKPQQGRIARTLRRYSDYLEVGAAASDIVGGFVPMARLFGGAMRTTNRLVSATGAAIKAPGVSAPQTIQEVKEEFAKLLKARNRPLLVVMDDLDRLQNQEVAEIFQLVKGCADLPGLTYLLLYQRTHILDSLKGIVPGSPAAYLGKMIQVEFTVPVADQRTMQRFFTTRLDQVIDAAGKVRGKDPKRFARIFCWGIRPYIRTIRDINRLISSLEFQIGLMTEAGALNANPLDLLMLEVLRLNEPGVFAGIAERPEELIHPLIAFGHIRQEDLKRTAVGLLDAADADKKDSVRALIVELFPQTAQAFELQKDEGKYEDWGKDLRVCHKDMFDRYFQLTLLATDLSHAEFDALLEGAGDSESTVKRLRSLKERGLLEAALVRLSEAEEEIPADKVLGFAVAIYDIGDDLAYPENSDPVWDVPLTAIGMVSAAVKRLTNGGDWVPSLVEVFNGTNGLYFPVWEAGMLRDRVERREAPPGERIPSTDQVTELEAIAGKKLKQAANDGRLLDVPQLARILLWWRRTGGLEFLKAWVAQAICTQHGLLRILTAFLGRDALETPKQRIGFLEEFVSRGALEQEVKKVKMAGLSDIERRALKTLKKGLEEK